MFDFRSSSFSREAVKRFFDEAMHNPNISVNHFNKFIKNKNKRKHNNVPIHNFHHSESKVGLKEIVKLFDKNLAQQNNQNNNNQILSYLNFNTDKTQNNSNKEDNKQDSAVSDKDNTEAIVDSTNTAQEQAQNLVNIEENEQNADTLENQNSNVISEQKSLNETKQVQVSDFLNLFDTQDSESKSLKSAKDILDNKVEQTFEAFKSIHYSLQDEYRNKAKFALDYSAFFKLQNHYYNKIFKLNLKFAKIREMLETMCFLQQGLSLKEAKSLCTKRPDFLRLEHIYSHNRKSIKYSAAQAYKILILHSIKDEALKSKDSAKTSDFSLQIHDLIYKKLIKNIQSFLIDIYRSIYNNNIVDYSLKLKF